ncbi:hypothetical protein KOAAANKH_00715 [Brevundimonas sp. NIBR10]|nr:hypothetical protein KOAAANKH_00715 [Brevundimonas sp. NIBR10]
MFRATHQAGVGIARGVEHDNIGADTRQMDVSGRPGVKFV